MRSANRSRAKPPPTRSGAACSGKKSNSPSSSPDAINPPLTRIRHGDSRHRNRNAQYLVGPSSKDFQALSAPLVADLESWMREQRAKLSRGNEVAKAMEYMLKRWTAFTRFLGDGRICLSRSEER